MFTRSGDTSCRSPGHSSLNGVENNANPFFFHLLHVACGRKHSLDSSQQLVAVIIQNELQPFFN
jgi:hypothetical protein